MAPLYLPPSRPAAARPALLHCQQLQPVAGVPTAHVSVVLSLAPLVGWLLSLAATPSQPYFERVLL